MAAAALGMPRMMNAGGQQQQRQRRRTRLLTTQNLWKPMTRTVTA
jgi:hypothetical protein